MKYAIRLDFHSALTSRVRVSMVLVTPNARSIIVLVLLEARLRVDPVWYPSHWMISSKRLAFIAVTSLFTVLQMIDSDGPFASLRMC